MQLPKVLIVDDEMPGGDLMLEVLQMDGAFQIDLAFNGQEGLDKYKQARPDLVIMDLNMPVMDGYESSQRIKSFDPLAKILVWTANTQDERALKSLKEGTALTLLQKPLRLGDLRRIIQKTLPHA